MRLHSLKHLADVVLAVARPDCIIVFRSSSLLAYYPELGEPGAPLETSFDADLVVEPCMEDLAAMLDEAVGENRRFHAQFGYHADFLRPSIISVLFRRGLLRESELRNRLRATQQTEAMIVKTHQLYQNILLQSGQ